MRTVLHSAPASSTSLRTGRAREYVARLIHAGGIFLAALHEIFDESAYSRFIVRRQIASSPASYAAFCREQEAGKARRQKCC
jgi:hypothetical protein